MIKFTHGVMGSGKSAALLGNYKHMLMQGLCPLICTSNGCNVTSRNGEQLVSFSYEEVVRLFSDIEYSDGICDFLLVDEAQFLTPKQVITLANLSIEYGFPIKFYGLLKDAENVNFPASEKILEIASFATELKRSCECCQGDRQAKYHFFKGGDPIPKDNYKVCCTGCYNYLMAYEGHRNRMILS